MSIDGVGGQNPISWGNLQTEFDSQLEAINNNPTTATLTVSEKENLALDRAVQKLVLDPPNNPNPSERQLHDVAGKMGDMDGGTTSDITALMYLFHEMTVINRQNARNERATQRDVQISELGNAADKIRDAARSAFISGMVMGAVSAAGGMMSVAGGLKSASSLKGTVGASKTTGAQHSLKSAQSNAAAAADDVKIQQGNVAAAKQNAGQANKAVTQADDALKTKQAELKQLELDGADPKTIKAKQAEVDTATENLKVAKDNKATADGALKNAEGKLADAEETSRIATRDFDKAMKKSKLTPEQKEETLLHKDRATIEAENTAVQKNVDISIQNSQRFNNYAQGASGITQGGGQMAAAHYNAEQKGHEAEQKDHEIVATQSETLAKDADDTMQSLRDLERDIREKLNAIMTAKTETNKKIMA